MSEGASDGVLKGVSEGSCQCPTLLRLVREGGGIREKRDS